MRSWGTCVSEQLSASLIADQVQHLEPAPRTYTSHLNPVYRLEPAPLTAN